MTRLQTTLLIITVSMLAAAGGFGLQQWLADPTPKATTPLNPQSIIGQPLASFSFISLAGEPLQRQQFAGRPLVINLWATWCGPCRKEMPDLDRLAAELSDDGVAVLGIALDQPAKVAEFLAETPVSYPIAITETAQGMAFARALGNRNGVLPYTVLVDASGVIRQVNVGLIELAELRLQVSRLTGKVG